jgi:hypothetical protein
MATELECAYFWFEKSKDNIYPIGFKFSNGFAPKPTEKSNQANLEYKQKCGMYDKELLECIVIDSTLQNQITKYANQSSMYYESDKDKNLPNDIANTKKKFADKGCLQKIEKYRQAELGKVANKFSSLDKERIEAESIYERNQRIFFGGLVLIGGIVIITMFSKKK